MSHGTTGGHWDQGPDSLKSEFSSRSACVPIFRKTLMYQCKSMSARSFRTSASVALIASVLLPAAFATTIVEYEAVGCEHYPRSLSLVMAAKYVGDDRYRSLVVDSEGLTFRIDEPYFAKMFDMMDAIDVVDGQLRVSFVERSGRKEYRFSSIDHRTQQCFLDVDALWQKHERGYPPDSDLPTAADRTRTRTSTR